MSDSGSNKAISADHAHGFVVGEHNIIYQYFQLPEHAHLAGKHISFASLIARKTRDFVGRQFVFDAFDDFLRAYHSGYFVILGQPGIGKTALLAQLVKMRGYVHHFNVASQNIRAPRQFLANACVQVIARYQLSHKVVPPQAVEDSGFLVQCLEEAAARSENRPVVLAVDALDESDHISLGPRANVLYLPRALPEGAYIVTTTRVLDYLKLEVDDEQRLFLEPNSEGNQQDIRAYIENQLQVNLTLQTETDRWGLANVEFIDKLAQKSEGNFIYLYYALRAIAEGKFRSGTVDKLPHGLWQYYRGHWEQMQIAEPLAFDQLYAPIVCFLAVAREPVSIDQLHEWTGLDRSNIQHALKQWREFLDVEEEHKPPRYRVYHPSFRDFLAEQIDLKRYDDLSAMHYLDLLKST